MIIILITINLDLVLLQVILNLEDNKLFNVTAYPGWDKERSINRKGIKENKMV